MTFISLNKYLEKWVMVCLTIFLLGYFFFPSSSKHNTFFYITVCIPIVLLLPSYYKCLKPRSWLTVSTLTFAFYLFLNSLWSIDYSAANSLKYLRYLFTLYCLFAATFLFYYKKPNNINLLFIAFIVVGFFDSCYGIYDHFNQFLIKSQDPLMHRYNDPIHSAMLAGLLLLTCFWLILESQNHRQKFLYLVLSIPFIIIMLLSKARGPQIAFFVSLFPLAYIQIDNIKENIILIVICLFSISLFLLFSDSSKMLFSRGLSLPYRTDIWLTSLQQSLDSFWFGEGASHKPAPITIALNEEFDHSHNIALAIFRMGGIVGLLLFSINLTLCFYTGAKQNKTIDQLWLLWLFFGVLCLMTNGKYPLTRPSSSWLAYWIPIGFICASYAKFLSVKPKSSKTNHKGRTNIDYPRKTKPNLPI